MGTNYYWIKDACSKCGHGEELHIGKSSFGWCFSLRIHPEQGIRTLADWKREWKAQPAIRDEYGRPIEPKDMVRIISKREGMVRPDPDWLRHNRAREGPKGLACHTMGVHAEGTFDYCDYEFS